MQDIRVVGAEEFRSIAAELAPEERVRLEMEEDVELLKAVLGDPLASKICALRWVYKGEESVDSVVPLLLSNCPELAWLRVDFKNHSMFDFVSSVLEHPSNKLKVLEIPEHNKGDMPRFFAALGKSKVSALALSSDGSPELCDYLAKDLLVRLEIGMGCKQVPFEVMTSLAKCTRLAELRLVRYTFLRSNALTHLPKCITKLELHECTFPGVFEWSFPANVQELGFENVHGVDGTQLGRALAVHLRAKGLEKLHLRSLCLANGALTAVGAELGRIKRLDLFDIFLNDASIMLIALVLQSPSNEMKELTLEYFGRLSSCVETYLVPALKHPNCNLNKLSLSTYREGQATARRVEEMFCNRIALLVLLQGQQVRRKVPCLLRRLPVEMFRLVGEVLL